MKYALITYWITKLVGIGLIAAIWFNSSNTGWLLAALTINGAFLLFAQYDLGQSAGRQEGTILEPGDLPCGKYQIIGRCQTLAPDSIDVDVVERISAEEVGKYLMKHVEGEIGYTFELAKSAQT